MAARDDGDAQDKETLLPASGASTDPPHLSSTTNPRTARLSLLARISQTSSSTTPNPIRSRSARLSRSRTTLCLGFALIIVILFSSLAHPTVRDAAQTHLKTASDTLGATWTQASDAWGSSDWNPWVVHPFGSEPLSKKQKRELLLRVREVQDFIESRMYWRDHTARRLDKTNLARLASCLETDTCLKSELTIALLANWDFAGAQDGITGGESVWALSMVRGLQAHNYTLLYPLSPLEADFYNQKLGARVPAILMGAIMIHECMDYRGPAGGEAVGRSELGSGSGSGSRSLHRSYSPPRNQSFLADWDVETSPPDLPSHHRDRTEHARGAEDPTYWTHNGSSPLGCAKTSAYPTGIEMWKLFAFHFWGDAVTPLGHGWSLAPVWLDHQWEQETEWAHEQDVWLDVNQPAYNRFIGYSIEDRCEAIPYLPAAEREHRGVILGKNADYYEPEHNVFHSQIAAAASTVPPHEEQPFRLVSAARDVSPSGLAEPDVELLGSLSSTGWYDALRASKLLLGMGNPVISPSPFDAMCLGVPFINPVLNWDPAEPDNRERWETQHNGLRDQVPPNVYHVKARDGEGLAAAMQEAVDRPIGRYIPERMKASQIARRMRALMTRDWKTMADRVVEVSYAGAGKDEYPWVH